MKRFFKDLFNVPNTISLCRLALTPLVPVFWLALDNPAAALVVGVVAGVTDLFDGILARKLNQITEMGALIDQLGDLVFESTVLVIAVVSGFMWIGWLLIYLFREFTVTIIRTYVYGNGGTLPSSWIGKAKSSLLQYAFFLLFLGVILGRNGVVPVQWVVAGITPGWLLVHGAMLSIVTGIVSGLIAAWHYLTAFVRFYIDKNDLATD